MTIKLATKELYRAPINLSNHLQLKEKPKGSKHKIFMGYGSCSVSGCPCRGYTQAYGSELCNNRGHKYTDH